MGAWRGVAWRGVAWLAPPHAGCHPVPRECPRDRTERRSLHAAHRWEKHPQARVRQEGTNDERRAAAASGGNRAPARCPPLPAISHWGWHPQAWDGQEGTNDGWPPHKHTVGITRSHAPYCWERWNPAGTGMKVLGTTKQTTHGS